MGLITFAPIVGQWREVMNVKAIYRHSLRAAFKLRLLQQ